jgi:hypothetical protein
MIRARLGNGVFILGLDAENVHRLKRGQPILVSLAELGGTDDVVIMYGERLTDIERDLEAVFGPLPQAQTLDEVREPQ